MDFDASDPNWWSALSAFFALIVAVVSLFAAIVANKAASRSAAADEISSQLSKGLARTCHARWDIKRGDPNLNLEQLKNAYRTAYFSNVGEEVAFNVQVFVGDKVMNDPVAKVQPGEEFEFKYDATIDPNQELEVFIEWDRPKEFEDKRMRTRRTF